MKNQSRIFKFKFLFLTKKFTILTPIHQIDFTASLLEFFEYLSINVILPVFTLGIALAL